MDNLQIALLQKLVEVVDAATLKTVTVALLQEASPEDVKEIVTFLVETTEE